MKINLLFLILLFGCTNSSRTDTNQFKDEFQELEIQVFTDNLLCVEPTENLLEEWLENGGGLKKSIIEMRKQVLKDEKSRFSQIIKFSWQQQAMIGFYEKNNSFGYWPVDDEKFRIARNFHFINDNPINKLDVDFPEECLGLSWLPELFNKEIIKLNEPDKRKRLFDEVPNNLLAESHDLEKWIIYWLFVNLENYKN